MNDTRNNNQKYEKKFFSDCERHVRSFSIVVVQPEHEFYGGDDVEVLVIDCAMFMQNWHAKVHLFWYRFLRNCRCG